MSDIPIIDADYSSLHGVVKFRNHPQQFIVTSASKAASNAKNLREAASLINSSEERPKAVVAWLIDLAGKYERCESE